MRRVLNIGHTTDETKKRKNVQHWQDANPRPQEFWSAGVRVTPVPVCYNRCPFWLKYVTTHRWGPAEVGCVTSDRDHFAAGGNLSSDSKIMKQKQLIKKSWRRIFSSFWDFCNAGRRNFFSACNRVGNFGNFFNKGSDDDDGSLSGRKLFTHFVASGGTS